MICPYCKKEMQRGYIYNGKDDIRWTPEGCSPGSIVNFKKEGEIILAKSKHIKRNRLLVYRCQDCKIQIIDENNL